MSRGLMAWVLALLAAGPVRASDDGVIVFGGTGRLGAEVVKALVSKGDRVTVFARPTSDRSRLAGLPVRYVEGDVLDERDVERAFRSARFRVAVDALARSESGPEFYAVSMRHLAKWAAATGVRQVILHGSVGAGGSRAVYPPGGLARMARTLDAKTEGEQLLAASDVTYTIIRNAVLFDLAPGATDAARLYPDETRFGVVTRTGLGRLTAECVDNPGCANRIFHAVDETMPLPPAPR